VVIEVALGNRVQLLWKELPRDSSGYDDRIGQRQRNLRQHSVLRAVDDLRPTRHDELRQVKPEIQMRKGRRDAENLPGDDADNHGHKGDGRTLVAHQQQHERRNNDAEPKLLFHQVHAKSGKRQPEAKLKAGCYGHGQDTCNAADQAGCTDEQEESADDNSRPGNRARLHRLDQRGSRSRFHRLHGHGHAVKGS
jgi:hypothetical protein